MTKKDYELVAGALAEALGDAEVTGTPDTVNGVIGAIYAIANDFGGQDKRFKRDKFLADCGVQE